MKRLSSFDRLLVQFLALITLLLCFRWLFSGTIHFFFLGWNIFLAWIPYLISKQFNGLERKLWWKQAILFASWLLFFPNALYIVTDLVHLQQDQNMPWWFDVFLIFCSSFVGLLLAFMSLRRAEHFLRHFLNRRATKYCMYAIIFVASFGVYLGRFQRWNSWDVVNNPFSLGWDILSKVTSPFDHYKVWAITLLLTVVYSVLYASIKIIPRAISEIKNTG